MSNKNLLEKIKENIRNVNLEVFDESGTDGNGDVSAGMKRISGAYEIPIEKIKPSDKGIREETANDKDFELLVSSVKNTKVLHNIVVYYNEREECYNIIAGFRRFLAAQKAGLQKVPCIIKEKPSDKEILLETLIENLHRKSLNPFEEANAYRKLINDYGLTQAQIVEMFGKKKSKVSEILKIDSIPDSVREKVPTSELLHEHLIQIAKQTNEEDMLLLAKKISEEKLNIHQARKLSKELLNKPESKEKRTYRAIRNCERLAVEVDTILDSEIDISSIEKIKDIINAIKDKIDRIITATN